MGQVAWSLHRGQTSNKNKLRRQNSSLHHGLKGKYHGDFDLFWSKLCFSTFFIYKVILEHQEKEINKILERGTNYGLFQCILETKMREIEKMLA